MRRARFLAVFLAVACGADNAEAPKPPPAPTTCKSFQQLMPAFASIIANGQTQGLQQVVASYLAVSDRPDRTPAAADVLRAIFVALSHMAAYPPEPGAPPNLVCVPDGTTPPPLSQADPLCEVRRVLYKFVHQGQGIAALQTIDPAASGALDYIVGRPPSSSQTHFEVATAIDRLCQQDTSCQVDDTLDLIIAITAFFETSDGMKMLDDTDALLTSPDFRAYLSTAEMAPDGGQSFGGEDGVVALVDLLLQVIEGMSDPSALDKIPVSVFPQNLQALIQPLIADAKLLLDPNRSPSVLAPLKKVLGCYDQGDAHRDIVRMVYRLAFVANGGQGLPAFQIAGIANVTQGLRQIDTRGSILYLVNLFATAIRNDPSAADSSAKVCRELFSNDPPLGGGPSNAQLALPDIATLFDRGVASEALCAVDTLVYGCAGGTQPACP